MSTVHPFRIPPSPLKHEAANSVPENEVCRHKERVSKTAKTAKSQACAEPNGDENNSRPTSRSADDVTGADGGGGDQWNAGTTPGSRGLPHATAAVSADGRLA